MEKIAQKSIIQHDDDVLNFWTPQRKRSLTEQIFNFIYLGTKFISPHNIEKLPNLHTHVYYNMLVDITSDRIKIAQYWCKCFSQYTEEQYQQKGTSDCLIT